MTTIIESRLAEVLARRLQAGAHASIEDGACVMEAVSYVAGEPWSDSPKCASPVIGAFLRAWQDALTTEDRERLIKPLITKLVGSSSTEKVERRRSLLALDWILRTFTPAWLDLVPALESHATKLRSLPHIDCSPDSDTVWTLVVASQASERAVRDAHGRTTDQVRDVLATAGSAALDAVALSDEGNLEHCCYTAWTTVLRAAQLITPENRVFTIGKLQQSALDLIDRMLALQE